jgi:CheY-like chemotaxis protein
VHFMSGHEEDMNARKMGAIGYLLKPVSMTDLSDAFRRIEGFIARNLRNVLILVNNLARGQEIVDLVGSKGVQPTLTTQREEAWQHLQGNTYDCIIIDVDTHQGGGLAFLEQINSAEKFSQIPVLIYANRELTPVEDQVVQRCEAHLTVKEIHSPERLLDEATLFLHQLEANLPKEQRSMLRMVHDKESILRGRQVLLVDDDMRNTFALTGALEERGMEVLIAQNGKEALVALEKTPNMDLVLMDIMMPEMDGYETMQRIREQARFRKLPIIALTAKAMKSDKTKCIEAGANDYLSKPIDIDKLLSLMRVWLYR